MLVLALCRQRTQALFFFPSSRSRSPIDLDDFPADRHTPVHSARPVTSDDPIHFRDRLDIDYLAHSQPDQMFLANIGITFAAETLKARYSDSHG
jgi:hypothetical protein